MPFKNLESKKDADGNVKKQDFIDCAAADLKGDKTKAELVFKLLAGNSDKVHVTGDQFKWKSSFIQDFMKIDKDGSSTVSKAELASKLRGNEKAEKLIKFLDNDGKTCLTILFLSFYLLIFYA
jgi:hypothetical protein